MKRIKFTVAVLVVVGITIGVAWAANPHYKHGGEVTCSPASASVTGSTFSGNCTAGAATGLGNEDLTFGVIASGSAGTFCHNKGNPSNIVPGQNPAAAQFASLQTIPGSAIKNGNATLPAITFSFSLNSPTIENEAPNTGSCEFLPRSIAERAESLGGRTLVSSANGRTVVQIEIPL